MNGDSTVVSEEIEAYIRYEAGLLREKPLVVRMAEELEIPADELAAAIREARELPATT